MPPLDPRQDFQDDGGTPAWRANQDTWRRKPIIDATPEGGITLRQWFRSLKPMQIIGLGIFVALIPLFILTGGFLLIVLGSIFEALFYGMWK